MSEPFTDTDVIIRLLTRDDPAKQAAAYALFRRVEAGELTIAAPDTVIADAVYVLSSPRLYRLPRADVHALLVPLVQITGFRVANRRAVLRALEVYASTRLDFGDAIIVAFMEQRSSNILYSYDTDFDRVPGLSRRAPDGQ